MRLGTQRTLLSQVVLSVALFGCSDATSSEDLETVGGAGSGGDGGAGAASGGATDMEGAAGSGAAGSSSEPGSSGSGGAQGTAEGGSGGDSAQVGDSGAGGSGADDEDGVSDDDGAAGTQNGGSAQGGTTANAGTDGDDETAGETANGGGTPVPSDGCPAGQWPEADPSQAGPFEVATENDVGPEAGEPEEDGAVPRFTLFRPQDMEQSGLCHPVITWGNGTGSTPNLYGGLLRHLASHGFVIIGSNSTNVSRGEPKPMNVGIDWVLEQNEDPSSALYHRIDTAQIGATGHSQGAMATTQASSDERIVTSVPIQGASVQRDLHGPAMFFCGGLDDIVSCDGALRALEAVTTLPAMYANYLTADHGSWLSFGGNQRSEVETAITAWMRVHLMADGALRPWFYGDSCELCTNDGWEIDRKNMDE